MIEVLSRDTIEKIAAGEVVERPLSVVKELCENAIDAGSTAISVELKGGGIDYIRVSDNGCGILSDEVEKAFMRHATSKISSAEDLFSLNTLGFRGEALFSIAAVSKTTMYTRTEEEVMGISVVYEGGALVSKEEIAAPKGSTFIVRELFFNTPARLKFLKSPSTEGAAVCDLLEYLALSRPDISFRLISDGKEKMFTSGRGDLKTAVAEVFGIKSAGELLEIDDEKEGFKVRGFLGKSLLSRGNRKQEIFFVNGRFIRDTMLSKALEEGYRGFMMQQRYPFCVLFLDFKDGACDVNVHPSKMEVRFDEPTEIQKALSLLVYERLHRVVDIDEVTIPKPVEPESALKAESGFESKPEPKSEPKPVPVRAEEKSDTQVRYEPFEKKAIERIKKEVGERILEESPYRPIYVQQEITPVIKDKRRIIGQVFGTYWLMESEDKLYVLDQHAAHEKVLYERTMKLIKDGEMSSQMLMPPPVISLSATEEDALNHNMDSFTEAGFMIEHFEGRDYRLLGVPATLPKVDFATMFLNAIEEGMSLSNGFITDKVASLSCKAAVKGNHLMSLREAEVLLEELFTLEDPYHCPHGRPTMISFSRYDMDKRFKRIL